MLKKLFLLNLLISIALFSSYKIAAIENFTTDSSADEQGQPEDYKNFEEKLKKMSQKAKNQLAQDLNTMIFDSALIDAVVQCFIKCDLRACAEYDAINERVKARIGQVNLTNPQSIDILKKYGVAIKYTAKDLEDYPAKIQKRLIALQKSQE